MLEINSGIWDGLTPDLANYLEGRKRFVKDPYSYRVPRDESYHDLRVVRCPEIVHLNDK